MRRILMMLIFALLIGSLLQAGELKGERALFGLNISPNPFEFETTITVYSERPSFILVMINNDQNELVKTIYCGDLSAGHHQFGWNGSNDEGEQLPSGKYTCEVTDQSKFTSVKKIIILK